uniref:Uncharacterized protein n=1 Tax=Pseudomonas phage HRDY3 TaxID=3236930 RepID=A0AB39CET0_9VIRU
MKFVNSRPHNLSLITGDVSKKLKTTKAMKGYCFDMSLSYINFVAGSDIFAYVEIEVGKSFNGFRLYHTINDSRDFLLMEYNVGPESHITKLAEYAHRQGGVKVPETMDEWLVETIAKRLAKIKLIGNYLIKLQQGGKNARQLLYKVQSEMGLPISHFVFDAYTDGETMLGSKFDLVEQHGDDVLVAYNRMFYDLREQGSGYETIGLGFYPVDEHEAVTEDWDRRAEEEEEKFDDDHEEEEEDFEQRLDIDEDEDQLVDNLSCLSTTGLSILFNAVIDTGAVVLEDSEARLYSGLKRRNIIIDELAELLDRKELFKVALEAALPEGDAQLIRAMIPEV